MVPTSDRIRQRTALSFLLFAAAAALFGCGGRKPATGPPQAQAPRARAADFVLVIDNSRSISPAEQELVREVTMLLADLADSGDRIALIPFGAGARLATVASIQTDQDRVAFKREVGRILDFQETRSDITQGLRVLADNQATLFRERSIRVPVVLSDGKLEPAAGGSASAFEELKALMRGPLARLGIYAVALGDTTSHDAILPGLDGLTLMREHIARGPSLFYHARTLDQLLNVSVAILSRAKGGNALGEEGKTVFKIDRSVESAMFIVRKKSTRGDSLCTSSEIRLRRREPAAAATASLAEQDAAGLGSSLYWAADYEYFDLIAVRQPREGLWEVTLPDGRTPELLSKVVSNLELQVAARDRYYLNESGFLGAILYDRAAQSASKAAFKVQAHLSAANLQDSNVYVPMPFDQASGEYGIEVPAAFQAALAPKNEPGQVRLEVIAEQYKAAGGTELDPWFIRRSPALTIDLAAPFVEWIAGGASYIRLPFWTRSVPLGAAMAPLRSSDLSQPRFETAPQVVLTVEGLDGGVYRRFNETQIAAAPGGGQPRFLSTMPLPDSGEYRYRYRLTGSLAGSGPLTIYSPWFTLRVRFPWLESAAVLILLVGVISWWCARLRGTVEATHKGRIGDTIYVNQRRFESTAIPELNHAKYSFRITAIRWFFVYKRLKLASTRGSVSIEDSGAVAAPGAATLKPGVYELRCGDTRIEVTLSVR